MNENIKSKLIALLNLQAIDAKIDEVEARIQKIPEREKRIREKDQEAKGILESKREQLRNMRKTIDRKNIDLETEEEKINKYKGQRFQVKTNEAYSALEREIELATERKSRIEEEILNLLISVDSFSEEIKEYESKYEKFSEQHRAKLQELKSEEENLKKELASLMEEREKALAEVDPDIQKRYHDWRSRGDFMLSVVRGNSCSRCFMILPQQTIAELRKAEGYVYCNSCRRVLVWEGWLDEDA